MGIFKNYRTLGCLVWAILLSQSTYAQNQNKHDTLLDIADTSFIHSEKIAVDVTVDSFGNVVSASYQSRGSTTSEEPFVKLALARAYRIKFSLSSSASSSTVIFHFRVEDNNLHALNGPSRKSVFRPAFSAAMDPSLARVILHQCSRSTPKNVHHFWKLSDQDIQQLEENFYQLQTIGCCVGGLKIAQLSKFGYQYLGVIIKGRKYIYINAFPLGVVKQRRDDGGDPTREPIMVCDGGQGFWGVLFEMESNQFSDLSFNGDG